MNLRISCFSLTFVKSEENHIKTRCKIFFKDLPISLKIYLITGLVHMLLVVISQIVTLCITYKCDPKSDKYESCMSDHTRYKAYAPVLIVASIVFEIYNFLGVWNGLLAFIKLFVIFKENFIIINFR